MICWSQCETSIEGDWSRFGLTESEGVDWKIWWRLFSAVPSEFQGRDGMPQVSLVNLRLLSIGEVKRPRMWSKHTQDAFQICQFRKWGHICTQAWHSVSVDAFFRVQAVTLPNSVRVISNRFDDFLVDDIITYYTESESCMKSANRTDTNRQQRLTF
jgi:hypothetical protein